MKHFDIKEWCTNRSNYFHTKNIFIKIKKTRKCLKSCGEWGRSARVRLFSSIYVDHFLKIFQSNSDHFVSITTQFFTQLYRLCLKIPVPCHLSGPFQARNFVIMLGFLYTYTPAVYLTGRQYVKQKKEKNKEKPLISYEAINV